MITYGSADQEKQSILGVIIRIIRNFTSFSFHDKFPRE